MNNDPPSVPKGRSKGGVQYRLYFLSGNSHIHHSHEFEAADDTAAIEHAERWREGRRMELWQGTRMVKRWD